MPFFFSCALGLGGVIMRILSSYIAKQVAQATAIILIGFIGLELLFRIIDEMDNVINDYTVWKAIAYELLRTPETLYQMMPMVGLIGCLTGLGALASTSELTIIRAAGVPILKLVWMALRPAIMFLLVALLLGEFVAPEATRIADVMRQTSSNNAQDVNAKQGLWLRDGEDFVSINLADGRGRLFGINIFKFNQERQVIQIISAEQATFIDTYWAFEGVDIIDVNYDENNPSYVSQLRDDNWRWYSTVEPKILSLFAVRYPDKWSMRSLWYYMKYMEEQHLNYDEHALAFWKKVFYPLVMMSLVLVGISFVFGPLREVTMGYRLFTGVLVGVAFKIMQDALAPVSTIYGIQPALAMFFPGMLSSFIGLYMLSRIR